MNSTAWTNLKKIVATAFATIALLGTSLVAEPALAIPELPANPILRVIALNNEGCGIRVIGVIPSTPDAGSIQLEVNSSSSGILATLVDVAKDQPIDFNFNLIDPAGSLQSTGYVASLVQAGENTANMCEALTLKLKYTSFGSDQLVAEDSVTPHKVDRAGSHFVFPSVTKACTYRVIVTVPAVTYQDQVKVVFSQGVGGWDIIFNSVDPARPLDMEVNIGDLEATRANPRVVSILQWGEQLRCDLPVYVNMENDGAGSVWNQHFTAGNCSAGTYGKIEAWGTDSASKVCLPAPAGYFVASENFVSEPTPCAPGTFADNQGSTSCTPAPLGMYVSASGQPSASYCPVGSYSDATGAAECTVAPKGSYVTESGAKSATKCKKGLTTEFEGARSIHECYQQKFQTAKAINLPLSMSKGDKFESAARTDAGLALTAKVTGPCKVTTKYISVKINGKKVKQPRFVITAGMKAGTCKVNLHNAGDYTYKKFTKVRKIKITK